MPIIAGIDEAGRGPVIGPMVMAIAVIDSQNELALREMGVKDSKQLAPKQRDVLFDQLQEVLPAYKYVIITPKEIDANVESCDSNLNWLEADKTVELFQLIIKEIHVAELFIDCPSTNIESYLLYLHPKLDLNPSCVTAEHKADVTYPIVSAASIIAKVIRDREIKKIQAKYHVSFGSGYSSDENTISFLKAWARKHKKFPEYVRGSWATAKNILKETLQRKLTEFS